MAQTKPKAGQFYGVSDNGTDGQFLQTDGTGGMAWANATIDPVLTSIDYPGTQTAADPAGGESIIINGTGFQTGITCTIGGTSATTAFNSATQITITSPAKAAGQYTVEVTNTDGGSGSSANFIQYSGVPVWSTNAGSLGSVMEGGTTSFQVTATEGSDTIEYAVTSGSLPSGYSLATATGAITGTAGTVSADTTSTFSITATDDENQTSSARSFSITVTNDVASNYFNTVLYTGTSASHAITGVGFKPDLVWIKRRSSNESHALYDSIRGINEQLSSDTGGAEATNTAPYEGLTAFNNDGFTVDNNGGTNSSGQTYVAWNFKGGGAPTATNSAGAGNVPTLGSVMINGTASTSAVAGNVEAKKMSVNTTLEFSVVDFTSASGSTNQVPHGLSGIPDLFIFKRYDATQDWYAYTQRIDGSLDYLILNGTDAKSDSSETVPTATTVYQPTSTGGRDYMLYSFKSVSGFSKIDKYTGNGNASGPIVETGFKPAWLMVKRTDSTSWWNIQDNKRNTSNPRINVLGANDASAEINSSSYAINFYNNGFQIANSHNDWNASGSTYLYIAFAADPSTTTPSLADSFATELYTGNSSTTQVTSGFRTDLVFIKARSAVNNWVAFDTVRGMVGDPSYRLVPSTTSVQSNWAPTAGISAADATSITVKAPGGQGYGLNESGVSQVAFMWKAGGLGSIDTTGSSTSIVSVNQAAGISVAQYTGTGSAATIAHGLGAVPKMTIIKGITGTPRNWVVFHSDLTAYTYELYLNDQGSEYNSAGAMQAAAPTSTLISLGTDDYVNGSGNQYICYSFAEVTGFSSFGTYEATGSAGTPTITTGFQPDWVMIKNIDRTQEWIVIDSVRGLNKSLQPNSDAAESVNGNIITTNATSFTINVSGGGINYANGDTMIYAAFKIN